MVLTWSPKNDDLLYDVCARTLTAEAALSFHSDRLKLINSAAYQKSVARTKAYEMWNRQYQWRQCMKQFNSNNGIPRSFAYNHILIDNPSGHNHPLWREATSTTKDTGPKKPKYHHCQTSTAFQLAVDHAFMGSYTLHFHPSDPPETHACPCGHHPMRDPNHFIHKCPLLSQQRRDVCIQTNFNTLSLRDIFNKFPNRLLAFLFLQTPSYIYQPPLPSQCSGAEPEVVEEGIGWGPG